MYFLYVAKGNVKSPKEHELVLKYAGKADKSLKDRLDAHGRGCQKDKICIICFAISGYNLALQCNGAISASALRHCIAAIY